MLILDMILKITLKMPLAYMYDIFPCFQCLTILTLLDWYVGGANVVWASCVRLTVHKTRFHKKRQENFVERYFIFTISSDLFFIENVISFSLTVNYMGLKISNVTPPTLLTLLWNFYYHMGNVTKRTS